MISTVYIIIISTFRFLHILVHSQIKGIKTVLCFSKIHIILFKVSHLALLFQKEKIKLGKLFFQNYFVKMSLK